MRYHPRRYCYFRCRSRPLHSAPDGDVFSLPSCRNPSATVPIEASQCAQANCSVLESIDARKESLGTNGGVAARLSRFAFSAHEPTAVFSCPVVLRSSALLPFAVLFLPVVFASSAQKPGRSVCHVLSDSREALPRPRQCSPSQESQNRNAQPLPPLPLILGQCPSSKRGVLPAMHVRAQGLETKCAVVLTIDIVRAPRFQSKCLDQYMPPQLSAQPRGLRASVKPE